tara:strand:- start:96 stop:512 length:417 start_codon:yes stop_codon:yes gene_type:complete
MWNLYDLVDQEDQTVYVGVSKHLKIRLREHTLYKPYPKSGRGKFYGRTDLDIITVNSYSTKKEALMAEGARKLSLGMEWEERNGQLAKKYSLRKLTQEQAEQIRHKHIPREYTIKKLAKEYNVSRQAISNILKNITYV